MSSARHTRDDLTLYERLLELETDMSAVQDAVGQLAVKLDQVERLMNDQEAAHTAALNEQIARADELIARLQGTQSLTVHEAPESAVESPTDHDAEHGLMS